MQSVECDSGMEDSRYVAVDFMDSCLHTVCEMWGKYTAMDPKACLSVNSGVNSVLPSVWFIVKSFMVGYSAVCGSDRKHS